MIHYFFRETSLENQPILSSLVVFVQKRGNLIALILEVEDTEMMEVRKSGVLRTIPLMLIVALRGRKAVQMENPGLNLFLGGLLSCVKN